MPGITLEVSVMATDSWMRTSAREIDDAWASIGATRGTGNTVPTARNNGPET